MPGPLEGVRVVDSSQRSVAAALAGMMLGDLGAEVVRLEPEGGDPLRALAGSDVWLRGQRSVTTGNGPALESLRSGADVLIHTVQPGVGRPPHRDPGQVRVLITALPRTVEQAAAGDGGGPAYGELLEARYGFQHAQDGVREGPVFLGWPLAASGAAWLTVLGVTSALFERERSGRGQDVTCSLLDGMAILGTARWVGGDAVGDQTGIPSTIGRMGNARVIVSLFECADAGWVQVHTGPRGAFDRLVRFLGREDLVAASDAPLLAQLALSPEQADELWEQLPKIFRTRPAAEWQRELAAIEVCCMPALLPGQALSLEQLEANGLVDLRNGGRRLGRWVKYARTPMEVGFDAPAAGADTAEVLETPARSGPAADDSAAGLVSPLQGLLVLDLGFFMAGPFAPRVFADLGARVIKVEEVRGEPMRGRRISAGFLGVQRGKEGLALDLKTAEGREIFHGLVARADVVHHNMRAAALEKLGVDYATLRGINPRLIYCHSSGYGNEGPWAALPTLEPLHSALVGLLARTGGQGNRPVQYLSHMDYGCALTAAAAVLAALVERERSGQGQYLEVPQTGAGLLAMADAHFANGELREAFPLDAAQRGHAASNALYPTSDGWITLGCYGEAEWQAVPGALGIAGPWPSFAQARAEPLGESPTAGRIEAALAGVSTVAAAGALERAGVPAQVPARAGADRLLADPLLRELGVLALEHQPEIGAVWEVAHTLRFERSRAQHRRPAPSLGADSAAILAELGYSRSEVAALAERGVVGVA